MDETTVEATTEQAQQVSPNLQEERDPVREAERELGYDELSLPDEESAENASYLATVAMFGNRMMLEILHTRLNASKKTVGRDSNEFLVIKELMDNIVAGYEDIVNKDNFPTKYGNMLEKYGQLGGACKMYLSSHSGERKTKEGAKRVHHVEQIGQVVEREMQIIRERSGVLAKSKTGMSWKEMFASEGRMEIAQNQWIYEATHQNEPGEPPKQQTEPKDPAVGSLEAQVQRLQN